MTNAYGCVTWWGFSPALHLLQELTKYEVEWEAKKEINILLVGGGDGRHILKTISKLKTCTQRINFFVVENNMEAVARQILFMTLLFEPPDEMSMQEKSQLFLELFGNSLVRTQTDNYLRKRCDDFIEWITNSAETRDPIWNFSNLKFKERDDLEGVFKLWRTKSSEEVFDIGKCWEGRLRSHFGVRYDSRLGAYDWEYSMKLSQKTKIIRWAEYKHWREYGIAFRKHEDSSYEVPNKTLASGVTFSKDGERIARRGYWGDVMNGPYYSYGVDSPNKSMLEMKNGEHTKTATDVSYFNIMSIIHELHTGLEYTEKNDDNDNNVIIEEVEESLEADEKDKKLEIPNIMIYLLPTDCIQGLHKKSKFQSKFDLVFFSNSMVHNLNNSINPLFTNDSLLVVESTRFMLDLKDEMHGEYKKKITAMALDAGCEEAKTFDSQKHNFAFFKCKGC